MTTKSEKGMTDQATKSRTATTSITFPDGHTVCRLGQGTWNIGKSPARRDEEVRALRRGLELGLTVIDTAEMYGNETLVGEAIGNRRDQAFIVSKVLPSNASYEGTKRACEGSLRRLGTDRIDLYLLHWKGSHPFADTVRAMCDLAREGKIISWGVSNIDVHDMEHITALPGGDGCAADQVLYNLNERGVEFDLIPWCAARRMPVMAYSPLDEGRLRHDPAVNAVARRHGATPAQVAIAWTLRLPGIISIPKAGSVAHVEDNHRALTLDLTNEDLATLDAAFPPPRKKIPLAGW